jgi:pimeloyl-ACP methyl ester carboxylesterase
VSAPAVVRAAPRRAPVAVGRDAPVRCWRPARDAQPVRTLLLHGLGGSREVWQQFVAQAPPALELWVAELPWASASDHRWSHGDSDATGWVTSALHAVEGGVDLVVAHSFAANLVLELLCRRGAPKPRAAVLISPFYRPSADDFDWAAIARYLNDFHDLLEEGLRVNSGDRLDADMRAAIARRIRERIGPYGWSRFFGAYLRTPFLPVGELTVPLLVVSGDSDGAAAPSDGRALADAAPAGRYALLAGCGHFAMAEHPEQLAAQVAEFLESLATHPTPTLDAHRS